MRSAPPAHIFPARSMFRDLSTSRPKPRMRVMRRHTLPLAATAAGAALVAAFAARTDAPRDLPNDGLELPSGFRATLFADSLSAPRHMVVATNGDLIVGIRSTQQVPGGVVVLRDVNGD